MSKDIEIYQIYRTCEGRFNILKGRVISSSKNLNRNEKVIPINRNGRSKTQIIGYNMRAKIAKGQHKKSKISHKIKVFMFFLVLIYRIKMLKQTETTANSQSTKTATNTPDGGKFCGSAAYVAPG